MQFVGSKNRVSKEIAPIIQQYINQNNIKKYVEPFVGGANMIDKIKCDKKIGNDAHMELISLLTYAQTHELPETITENEYNVVKNKREDYPSWYVGLVGFCGSFGAKYFGGFARRYNKDESLYDVPAQAIRSLKRQQKSQLFRDVEFLNKDYLDLEISDSVIYCDPPYKNTTKYVHDDFDYNVFYDWCIEKSKNNIVLVSEYSIDNPNFKEIWNKEVGMSLGSGVNDGGGQKRVERLYVVCDKNK